MRKLKIKKKLKKPKEVFPIITGGEDRAAQINAFVKDVNKKLKRAKSLGRIDLGSSIQFMDPPRISTGILGLDILMNGGIPRGMMTQLWGPYSVGKTTNILHAIQCLQRDGGTAAFAAAEGFQKNWARKNGVLIPYSDEELEDMDEEVAEEVREVQDTWPPFVVLQHAHGDGLLEMVVQSIKSNLFDLLIVDSVAAIKRFRDIEERSMEDEDRGGEAKMFSQLTKKVYSALNTRYDPETMAPTYDDDWVPNKTAIVVLNQARVYMGYTPGGRTKLQPTGGEALKHAWGVSIELSQGPRLFEKNGEKKEAYCQEMRATCEKSKVGPPFREAEWDFYFKDHGEFSAGEVDTAKEVFGWAVFYGLIDKKGAWFSFNGERLGQGADASIEKLRDYPDALKELYAECIQQAKR